MSFFRSKWVTGALVVAAIGFCGYQFKPMWDRRHPRRSGAAPAPAPAAAAPVAAATPSAQVPMRPPPARPAGPALGTAGQPIDRAYVRSHIAEWIESPRRDPFMFATEQAPATILTEEAPSQIPTWKLKSIWRQTGSRMAAINNGIYKEGDDIEGWRVERIDSDQVWFRGTNRVESLTFPDRMPAVVAGQGATNAPAKRMQIERLLFMEPPRMR